jgi:acetyltransferase-like isoleucine patch superfamily enzyme
MSGPAGWLSRGLLAAASAGSRARSLMRRAMYAGLTETGPGVRFLDGSAVANIRGERAAVRIGAHSIIGGELLTFAHGGSIAIGKWCFVGVGTRIWSAAGIVIGDRVLVSHGVNIHDSDSHPRDPGARHEQFVAIAQRGHPRFITGIAAAPVTIGDDAWIGFNATVLKGVTIGARSIVGAGSIVTRDVPPDSLYIGNAIVGSTK